jgi:hypothetical protein
VGADRTFAGWPYAITGWPNLPWANARPGPVTVFSDVPSGDQIVRITHPSAGCETFGTLLGDRVWGFSGGLDQIRVPVLAGHQINIAGICECSGSDRTHRDPATCEPKASSAADAGTP